MSDKTSKPVQPTMLYKADGAHKIEGVMVQYEVFEGEAVASALKAGWKKTVAETQKDTSKK